MKRKRKNKIKKTERHCSQKKKTTSKSLRRSQPVGIVLSKTAATTTDAHFSGSPCAACTTNKKTQKHKTKRKVGKQTKTGGLEKWGSYARVERCAKSWGRLKQNSIRILRDSLSSLSPHHASKNFSKLENLDWSIWWIGYNLVQSAASVWKNRS